MTYDIERKEGQRERHRERGEEVGGTDRKEERQRVRQKDIVGGKGGGGLSEITSVTLR